MPRYACRTCFSEAWLTMGLDAGVRCRCWEDGKTTPCPFAAHVGLGTDMDVLELELPWEGNEEMHRRFEQWRWQCCPHQGMWLVNERIGNWSGVRDFQQALRAAGEARFASLLTEIPNLNGGRTPPAAARRCLAELDEFAATGAFGSQVWLIDAETGNRLHNRVEAYEGVFIWSGKGDPVDIGVDRRGLFVRRPDGEELFRSMKLEQIQRGEHEFEFRDLATSRRMTCSAGVGDMTASPDTARPHYPRTLAVEESANHTDEYRGIVARLRTAFEASVQTGHPVSWF